VRLGLYLILFFILSGAHADSADYTVSSFYQASGYLTERFIPFAVRRPDGHNVDQVVRVTVARPCYSMVDPYRPYIFHIYCEDAAQPSFSVLIKDGGQMFTISLPAIMVRKVALISSTPKPGGGGSGGEPDLELGRSKFNSNCLTCHGSNPLPGTVTPAQITTAFNSYSDMSGFRNGFFSQKELEALAKYISAGRP